jgi:LETM1 and EF-hand domain-containing protein 1
MIQKLENHIEGPALSEGQFNTKDKEEIVSIEELIASIRRINAIEDSANLYKIVHILDHIDVDRDGVITVEEVMKVKSHYLKSTLFPSKILLIVRVLFNR